MFLDLLPGFSFDASSFDVGEALRLRRRASAFSRSSCSRSRSNCSTEIFPDLMSLIFCSTSLAFSRKSSTSFMPKPIFFSMSRLAIGSIIFARAAGSSRRGRACCGCWLVALRDGCCWLVAAAGVCLLGAALRDGCWLVAARACCCATFRSLPSVGQRFSRARPDRCLPR